ncbi:MAG: hypothetical protein EOP88_12225 [Verrucomicrobiaceae bacterium]|nr:MAG: hypothetical protein EOP88_12225 [Verrucomicrobiaceae bacterium]
MRLPLLLLSTILTTAAIALPPGTVIHHSPSSSGKFIGSPSLCILPNGDYLASHDFFGPKSGEHTLAAGMIHRSSDRGVTWKPVAEMKGFFWQGIFVHRGAAYAMGVDRHHGRLVIRRSDDGGSTWSEPKDAASGLLAEGEWHTAPVPVIEHDGRLWRAVEDAMNGKQWGERYRVRMASAPVDADLLDGSRWTITNPLPRDGTWLGGKFKAWLEGNAVAGPDGRMWDIARVDRPDLPERAALVEISPDGKNASFDPSPGFVDFPGGAKKFTIRKDPSGTGYWAVVSIVGKRESILGTPPAGIRNTLALSYSADLRQWETRSILLHHPDVARHGFQYVDWQFDGTDLIAACRTAWEDGEGGASNNHDANFLTFHRWKDFRNRMEMLESPATTYRTFTTEEKDGRVVAIKTRPEASPPTWAKDVSKQISPWSGGPDPAKPFFEGPVPFVIKPDTAGEPFFKHNHQPSVAWLDNGDLLAVWYTTGDEKGTELTVLASRLRAGKTEWDPAAAFFKSPGHNMHGSSLFRDGAGRLHHLNGMAPQAATGWDRLACLSRTSTDDGVTWSEPHLAAPDYTTRHQVISGTLVTRDGTIYQNCDVSPGPSGGTALLVSSDHGKTWADPGAGKPAPSFTEGGKGEGTIAGIHASVVELTDGRLMAFGRSNDIDGRMPCSISSDDGKTWTYSASPFPPIGGGQRLVLMRLREGPLLLVAFTSADRTQPRARGMEFSDGQGGSFTGYGMYAALSLDDGKTWPVRKLLTPDSGEYDGGAWTGKFTATRDQAEHAGYLTCTQSPDGVIHLLSSCLHYRFNLAWLKR